MIPRNVADLGVVVGLLVASVVALLVPGVPWPVEWALAVPFLLVLPGYAVVAALFPESTEQSATTRIASPGWVARVALAVTTSVLVVAAVGILLGAIGQLTLAPAVVLVAGVTLVATLAAAIRRWRLAPERRAEPLAALSPTGIAHPGSTRTQSIATVVAVVVLLGSLGFVAATPAPDAGYSAVSMPPTDGDTGGENGTRTMVAGANDTVTVALANHEGVPTNYTLRLQLQRVGPNGTVRAVERLDRFRTRLDPNESVTYERRVRPSMTGENLRLQTLVFEDGAQGEPDLTLRVWVDVTEAGSS